MGVAPERNRIKPAGTKSRAKTAPALARKIARIKERKKAKAERKRMERLQNATIRDTLGALSEISEMFNMGAKLQ